MSIHMLGGLSPGLDPVYPDPKRPAVGPIPTRRMSEWESVSEPAETPVTGQKQGVRMGAHFRRQVLD